MENMHANIGKIILGDYILLDFRAIRVKFVMDDATYSKLFARSWIVSEGIK